tara:strand:- start:775 stop:969 length:195 start_codon:yes stop_codon:yes gene_type:complete
MNVEVGDLIKVDLGVEVVYAIVSAIRRSPTNLYGDKYAFDIYIFGHLEEFPIFGSEVIEIISKS